MLSFFNPPSPMERQPGIPRGMGHRGGTGLGAPGTLAPRAATTGFAARGQGTAGGGQSSWPPPTSLLGFTLTPASVQGQLELLVRFTAEPTPVAGALGKGRSESGRRLSALPAPRWQAWNHAAGTKTGIRSNYNSTRYARQPAKRPSPRACG